MHLARIQRRVPSAVVKGTGKLSRFKLAFNKNSRDGSAKCNAFFTGSDGDALPGVIYEIEQSEKRLMDAAEGLGKGYFQASYPIEAQNGVVESYLYVAHPAFIDDSIRPYDWYCQLVIRGAKQHEIVQDHVRFLTQIDSVPDPNRARSKLMFDLAHTE